MIENSFYTKFVQCIIHYYLELALIFTFLFLV